MIIIRIFLLDLINFSFWTECDDQLSSFVIYHNRQYTGYFAACACINRAIDNGIPIIDATYLASVTIDQLESIFCYDDGKQELIRI